MLRAPYRICCHRSRTQRIQHLLSPILRVDRLPPIQLCNPPPVHLLDLGRVHLDRLVRPRQLLGEPPDLIPELLRVDLQALRPGLRGITLLDQAATLDLLVEPSRLGPLQAVETAFGFGDGVREEVLGLLEL